MSKNECKLNNFNDDCSKIEVKICVIYLDEGGGRRGQQVKEEKII